MITVELKEYIEQMKKIYLDTERQLLEFSYIVPIDENQKLYSPKLYSILQFTCSQIDSLMKKIVEVLELKIHNLKSFKNLHCSLNWTGMLECQKIFFWETEKTILPFSNNFNQQWWIAYNKTKHGLPDGLKKGTLQNVINALSAAYVLNGIILSLYYVNIEKLPILDRKNWGELRVDQSTIHNIKMLRTYESKPFLSSFFYWLNSYHEPHSIGL